MARTLDESDNSEQGLYFVSFFTFLINFFKQNFGPQQRERDKSPVVFYCRQCENHQPRRNSVVLVIHVCGTYLYLGIKFKWNSQRRDIWIMKNLNTTSLWWVIEWGVSNRKSDYFRIWIVSIKKRASLYYRTRTKR